MATAAEPLSGLPQAEASQELARSWKKLTRAATIVAVLTSPALRDAFHERHALQCGFCTPGFLMTADAFLREATAPDENEIRTALSGNLCRCTGYLPIVEAVKDAAGRMPPGA